MNREFWTWIYVDGDAIDGADLIAMGVPESPRIGAILGAVRERKLDGRLAGGREAELALARELVEQEPA